MTFPISAALEHPRLDVMNFLNEVAESFPKAISLASGRPAEDCFDVQGWTQQIELFIAHLAEQSGKSPQDIGKMLGQYGKTNGIINALVAEMLKNDENILCGAEQVIITSGAQEAMAIIMLALFQPDADVLLITDPTYIGITGLAQICGIEIAVVECDEDGPRIDSLVEQTELAISNGKKAKGLYLIPDFNNPVGSCIAAQRRMELIRSSKSLGLKIFEDNPYGMFRYVGQKIATMKSLDDSDTVIYIGTFAKTICPGLRIGYLVLGKDTVHPEISKDVIDALSKVKSFTTVNTSQMAQAVAGGILLQNNCSLQKQVDSIINHYHANLEVMTGALQQNFSDLRFAEFPVSWNEPEGGFFITVTLPFDFGEQNVFECARDFGVICVPSTFFSVRSQCRQQVRLSFSYIGQQDIQQGIGRFADYVHHIALQKGGI